MVFELECREVLYVKFYVVNQKTGKIEGVATYIAQLQAKKQRTSYILVAVMTTVQTSLCEIFVQKIFVAQSRPNYWTNLDELIGYTTRICRLIT